MINPINHGKTPEDVSIYKVEPYVMAADVYGVHPHTGRGGWTWYTGSAGWMYQLILTSFLGIRREDDKLWFEPCVPPSWENFTIKYRYKKAWYHITLNQTTGDDEMTIVLDDVTLNEKVIMLIDEEKVHQVMIKWNSPLPKDDLVGAVVGLLDGLAAGDDELADVARLVARRHRRCRVVAAGARGPRAERRPAVPARRHRPGPDRAGAGDNGGIATLLVRLGDALSPRTPGRRPVERDDHLAGHGLGAAADLRALAGERAPADAVPLLDRAGPMAAGLAAARVGADAGIRRVLRATGRTSTCPPADGGGRQPGRGRGGPRAGHPRGVHPRARPARRHPCAGHDRSPDPAATSAWRTNGSTTGSARGWCSGWPPTPRTSCSSPARRCSATCASCSGIDVAAQPGALHRRAGGHRSGRESTAAAAEAGA